MGTSVGPNELGAMALRIQSEGDAAVLSTLEKVDSKAKQVGSRPVGIKIQALGIEASFAQLRALIQEIGRATKIESERAQALATLIDVEQELKEKIASGTMTLKERLEAAALLERTQSTFARGMQLITKATQEEKAAVVEETVALERLEAQTKKTLSAEEERAAHFAKFYKTVRSDIPVGRSEPGFIDRGFDPTSGPMPPTPPKPPDPNLAKASAEAQKQLNKEIAEGTRLWSLQARAADVTNKTVVAELLASADAQRVWLAQVQASTEQQTRFNMAVQQFERRIEAANIEMSKSPPQARRAAQALTTIAIISSTGVGSLRDFANAFGLLAATSSAMFLPEKWAGYAAGIGAVTVALTALIVILNRLSEVKPNEAVNRRIEGIKILSLAEQEYRRQIQQTAEAQERYFDRIESWTSFIPILNQYLLSRRKHELEEEQRQTSLALEHLLALRSEQAKAAAAATIDAAIEAQNATNQLFQASFQAQEAREKIRYDRGLSSLKQFFQQRSNLIRSSVAQEIKALEVEREQEAKRRIEPGDVGGEIAKQQKLRSLDVQIQEARIRGGQRQMENAEQRRQAELSLGQQILQSHAKILEIQGRTHEARMLMIDREVEAYRLSLQQEGTLTQTARDAMVSSYREAITTVEDFAEAQRQVQLVEQTMAIEIERINKLREQGFIGDREAGQLIAEAEQSRVAVLTKIADEMERFANTLKDPALKAAVQELRGEISHLGIDLSDPLVKARQDVNAQFDAIGTSLVSGIGNAIGKAAAGGAGGEVLQKALGDIMVSVGSALLTYGATMSGLLPALTNPFTSGPAAIVAGAALIALGSKLGATLTGSSAGGSSAQPQANQPIELQRIIIDPNSEASRRVSARYDREPGTLNLGTPVQLTVVGAGDPGVQREISNARVFGKRRGLP